jgi:hypothetical protein
MPRIIRFSAVPPTINGGQTSTLLWVVENADTVAITTLGNVSISGTQDVTPAATTTYILTATNRFGAVTAMATVNVNPPPPPPVITSFTATPNPSPAPGTLVTFTCVATGATSINIGGAIVYGTSGSVVIYPIVNDTSACIATNSIGQTDTKTITVVVNHP